MSYIDAMMLENIMPETFGSNYIGALVVIVASFIIAKIISFVFEKILPKIIGKTKTDIDDRIVHAIHNPIYYAVILIGALAAAKVAGITGRAEFYFERTIASILVVIVSIVVFRIVNILVEFVGAGVAKKTKSKVDAHILPFIKNVTKLVVLIVALLQILTIWEKDITPLLASAGIAGFAIAFAAKDTIANIFGGVSIYFDRPFKVGDRIKLDSGELGDVYEIGIRTTRIKTLDDTVIIIPNEQMASAKIINYNLPGSRTKIKMTIGVAYGSNVALVKKTLLKVANSVDVVLEDPKPCVLFIEHADFSLNFLLIMRVNDPRHAGEVKDKVNEGIDKEFRKAKIDIPFPTQTIYQKKG